MDFVPEEAVPLETRPWSEPGEDSDPLDWNYSGCGEEETVPSGDRVLGMTLNPPGMGLAMVRALPAGLLLPGRQVLRFYDYEGQISPLSSRRLGRDAPYAGLAPSSGFRTGRLLVGDGWCGENWLRAT